MLRAQSSQQETVLIYINCCAETSHHITTKKQNKNKLFLASAVTMLISLETLAMAGASNVQFAMDIEEWELGDSEHNPPPHLLAEEYYKEYFVTFTNHQEKVDRTGETRKRKCMRSIKTALQALVTSCVIMSDICVGGSRPSRQKH